MRARLLEVMMTGLFLATAAACGDSGVPLRDSDEAGSGGSGGAGAPSDGGVYVGVPGVCELAKCPQPFIGAACCTPLAQCGADFLGLGMSCLANPGSPVPERTCVLAECPTPPFGVPCCTTTGACGADPYGSGLMCYPTPQIPDAGERACQVQDCPIPPVGYRCCTIDDRCGSDLYGLNQCAPNIVIEPPPDGGYPPVSTEPPDDPSITGECPSFLGLLGPVWGCCSRYGVCGTFQQDECLLPLGTTLPPPAPDEDAGIADTRCTPP